MPLYYNITSAMHITKRMHTIIIIIMFGRYFLKKLVYILLVYHHFSRHFIIKIARNFFLIVLIYTIIL